MAFFTVCMAKMKLLNYAETDFLGKPQLNVLKDDLETAVRERDFMKAQDMQMEIDELDDNLTVIFD